MEYKLGCLSVLFSSTAVEGCDTTDEEIPVDDEGLLEIVNNIF